MSEPRYYASPVDYEAWRKGYMPPSEHVLIHELSAEGAKVIASSSLGGSSWWLVVKGKTLTPAQRKAIRYLMENMDEDDETEPATSQLEPSTSPTEE